MTIIICNAQDSAVDANGFGPPAALRRDDDDGVEDGDGVKDDDDALRRVDDDGDILDMGSVDARTNNSSSVVNEVAPARAPVDFPKWGCLGATSSKDSQKAQAKAPQSFTKTKRPGLTARPGAVLGFAKPIATPSAPKPPAPPSPPSLSLGPRPSQGSSVGSSGLWCEWCEF